MIVGVIFFIIALALILWLVRLAVIVAFGFASPVFPVASIVVETIVFLIVLCVVVCLLRMPFRMMHGSGRRDLRIIRRRYAMGEINEAQFKRMMKNLKDSK